MSTIITVSNQKGGVGKTTTAAALVSGISRTGKRTLGIDLDPQGNLGFCLGANPEHPYSVLDLLKGSVSARDAVCPAGDCGLLISDITLSSSGLESFPVPREYILKNVLAPILDDYDFIIIDTPPALNLLTVNAYCASDYLVIPLASDILSLVGVVQLKETIESVRETLNPRLQVLGILLTRFNQRTLLSRDVLEMAEDLAAQIGTRVFHAKIRSGVAVAEAPSCGESIFTYSPRSGAVKDYVQFLDEITEAVSRKEINRG